MFKQLFIDNMFPTEIEENYGTEVGVGSGGVDWVPKV